MSKKTTKPKKMDYVVIWRSIFHLEAVEVTDYSNTLKLAERFLSFAISNAKSEAGFPHMKRVENNYRSQLGEEPLSSLMRMVGNGWKAICRARLNQNCRSFFTTKKTGRALTQNENHLVTRAPMKTENQKIKKVSDCTKSTISTR